MLLPSLLASKDVAVESDFRPGDKSDGNKSAMEGNKSLLALFSFGENLFALFRSLFLDRSDPVSFFSFCCLLLLMLLLVLADGFGADDDVPPAPKKSSQEDKPWDTVSSPAGASLELLIFDLASVGGGGSKEETGMSLLLLPLSFILLLSAEELELLFFFLFL